MQRTRLFLLVPVVFTSLLAFTQDLRTKQNTAQVAPKNNLKLPAPVPEFAGAASLLSTNQGIVVGSPFTKDDQQNPSLLHFQLFVDGASPITSMELGADGKIYVGYTPPRSPVWYDPTSTNET